jgi:hypothetical protein
MEVFHAPHLAVGDHRNLDRGAHLVDPFPARRRPVAVDLGPAMDDQFVAPPASMAWAQSTARLVSSMPRRILAVNGMSAGTLGAHRADDGVQQFRLAEQRRAAAMAIDRRRRATEIDIDTGRLQVTRRAARSPP